MQSEQAISATTLVQWFRRETKCDRIGADPRRRGLDVFVAGQGDRAWQEYTRLFLLLTCHSFRDALRAMLRRKTQTASVYHAFATRRVLNQLKLAPKIWCRCRGKSVWWHSCGRRAPPV